MRFSHPGTTISLPEEVRASIAELASDADTREVWLIGSQASRTAHSASDWDLLVFSDREPTTRTKRVNGVDVLHVGPSGTRLLEGQSASMSTSFANFNWELVNPGEAKYVGLRFLPVVAGVARDSPSILRVPATGRLLWSRVTEHSNGDA